MTLSRWFRDYVYFPLGGNREGAGRTFANLFIVFFLCGLWHGAGWTFIAWGIYHGLLLVVERLLRIRYGFVPSGIWGQVTTLFLVIIGWVIFRSPSLSAALQFLHAMFAGNAVQPLFPVAFFLTPDKVVFLAAGVVVALAPFRIGEPLFATLAKPLATVGAFIAFFYSLCLVAANGFNPFIYFRF